MSQDSAGLVGIMMMLERIEIKLDRLCRLSAILYRKEVVIMADLSEILSGVTAIEGADQSIIALVESLSAELLAHEGDQAAIHDIAVRLAASTQAVVTAVNTYTPAQP